MQFSRSVLIMAFLAAISSSIQHLVVADNNIDINNVIDQVTRAHRSFQKIPHLTLDFSIHYDQIKGRRLFAFDTIDIIFRRSNSKSRLSLKGYMPNNTILYRDYAWDGKKGTSLELSPNSTQGDFIISPKVDTNLLHYNYYVNYLNYPDATGSLARLVNPALAKNIAGLTWLPKALIDDKSTLKANLSKDNPDKVVCVRIERPMKSVYWFDPDKGHALRRLDDLSGEGKMRTSTIFTDFEKIAGLWLPRRIIFEEYVVFDGSMGALDDPIIKEGDLKSRKTLLVKTFSLDPIPLETFVVPAPVGIKVHDNVNKSIFTHFETGDNKFLEAAELFVRGRPVSPLIENNTFLYMGIALVSILFCFLIIILFKRGRKRIIGGN